MKAKDLIKILSEHPEREVKFYNGYFEDWADITVHSETLIKEKASYLLERVNQQHSVNGWPLINMIEALKIKRTWELPFKKIEWYSKNEFNFKEVFMIYSKMDFR